MKLVPDAGVAVAASANAVGFERFRNVELVAPPLLRVEPKTLATDSWALADEMGWAKTYDANHVALARKLGRRLVTLDARLRRGTARFGFVIGPTEL